MVATGMSFSSYRIFFFFNGDSQIPVKALSSAPLNFSLMAEYVIVSVKAQETVLNGFLSYPFRYVEPPRNLKRHPKVFNRD